MNNGSQRKVTKPMASQPVHNLCPHCNQSFSRLDLHLRRNASCSTKANKMFVTAESQQQSHSGQITDTWSYNTFQKSEFEQSELPAFHLKPAISLPNCQQKHEWFEVNQHIEVHIAPRVYAANTVEEKNAILSADLYDHLAQKFGTVPPHTKKVGRKPHNRTIKKVREMKNKLKRDFRNAKKRNAPKEELAECAKSYHQCLRELNRLLKETNDRGDEKNAASTRNKFNHNFWKFTKNLLDDENVETTQPTFSKEEAHSYFSRVYSSSPHVFVDPPWLPRAPDPGVVFNIAEFEVEEIEEAVRRSRSSSTPSPLDQIGYRVFKMCPAIVPILVHIFNMAWCTGTIPTSWQVVVIKLLPKSTSASDPADPSLFRPIALTSCIGKLYTSILKKRLMVFMTGNHYINQDVQKAFLDGVPGCVEHQFKLWSALTDARRNQRNIHVCWLDIANAYGSVHHNLIVHALHHYHLPAHFIRIVSSLYSNLCAVVSTHQWISNPFHLQIGVYQGDPLSAAIFNVVINLLLDTIQSQCHHIGYRFSSSSVVIPSLQYADDTCLVSNSKENCQTMLDVTQRWLEWALMKAKVNKCVAVAITGQTGRVYDPKLAMAGEPLPFLADKAVKFLGLPITTRFDSEEIKSNLMSKLERYLTRVHEAPLTRQQKLRIYKEALIPRLNWLLTIADLPLTWVERTLEPLARKYLKIWSGLPRCADPSRLYLPRSLGGLEMPSLPTVFKKLQVTRYTGLLTSRDACCRFLAQRQSDHDKGMAKKFLAAVEANQVVSQHPELSRKQISKHAATEVFEADTQAHLHHARSLQREKDLIQQENKADDQWTVATTKLPENIFAFGMKAITDTLPHNSNLCLWKKIQSDHCPICSSDSIKHRQTQLHVLNNCPTALKQGRYNVRHDKVLLILFHHLQANIPPSFSVTADLDGTDYRIPQYLLTDLRPDIIVWNDHRIHIFELTVCWEGNFQDAAIRKEAKYLHLLEVVRQKGIAGSLHTIQVGSRGFLDVRSLDYLFNLTNTNRTTRYQVQEQLIQAALCGSYTIWALRNAASFSSYSS